MDFRTSYTCPQLDEREENFCFAETHFVSKRMSKERVCLWERFVAEALGEWCERDKQDFIKEDK